MQLHSSCTSEVARWSLLLGSNKVWKHWLLMKLKIKKKSANIAVGGGGGILWACQIFVLGKNESCRDVGLAGRQEASVCFWKHQWKTSRSTLWVFSSCKLTLTLVALTWWGTRIDLFVIFLVFGRILYWKHSTCSVSESQSLIPELMQHCPGFWHLIFIYIENLCWFSTVSCCSHFIVIFEHYINKCTFH